MKFFYIVILLLAALSSWIYQDNQKKLKKYTEVRQNIKSRKVLPQAKLDNQNTFDIPAPVSSLIDERDSSTVNIINDQENLSHLNVSDDQQDYLNSDDSNLPKKLMPRTRYSSREAYIRELSSQGIDAEMMNIGPDEFYIPNDENIVDPETNRMPAEE